MLGLPLGLPVVFFVISSLASCSTFFAHNGSSTMHNKERITFSSENSALGDCPAVLTGNFDNTTKGLVVLQEWWGMNEQIVEEASRISEQGNLVTIVPDLYRGKVATDHETAGHYMGDLDWPCAVKDVAGAVKYLLSKGRHDRLHRMSAVSDCFINLEQI